MSLASIKTTQTPRPVEEHNMKENSQQGMYTLKRLKTEEYGVSPYTLKPVKCDQFTTQNLENSSRTGGLVH